MMNIDEQDLAIDLTKGQVSHNKQEVRGLPCPKCPSSDGFVYYRNNGSGYCFVCGKAFEHKQLTNGDKDGSNKHDEGNNLHMGNTISIDGPLGLRSLTEETLRKYGVKIRVDEANNTVVGIDSSYYNFDGVKVATKHKTYRKTPTEKNGYSWEGSTAEVVPFGLTKFPSGGKFITITTGEEDAMACYQMLGVKSASISLVNGDRTVKTSLQDLRVYEWVASFEKIVLCVDNDESGALAKQELLSMFDPAKVLVMKLRYKDANEYLMKGAQEEFGKAWWKAAPEIMEGVKNLKDSMDFVTKPSNVQKIPFPWEGVNELTRGIRLGEVSTFISGTGSGKTTLMGELVWWILQETTAQIGCLFLENSERETAQNLVGTAMSYPLRFALENEEELQQAIFDYDAEKGETGAFEKARQAAIDNTLGTGRLWTLSDMDYNVNNIDKIISRARYFAKVLGCKYVFLDHISLVVSGGEHDGDERKALDEISTKLAMIVKELNIHLFLVSQAATPQGKSLEEGGKTSINLIRGTRGIGHISHNVYGIERNGQAELEQERNTTRIRVLKCRWTGRTGIASYLLFDHKTYRMSEVATNDDTKKGFEVVKLDENDEADTAVFDLTKYGGIK